MLGPPRRVGVGQFKLSIMSMQCYDTEDAAEDEAYLIINGERVWSNNHVNEPNTYPVNTVSRA